MDCKQFFKALVKKGLLLQIVGIEADALDAKIPVEVDSLL